MRARVPARDPLQLLPRRLLNAFQQGSKSHDRITLRVERQSPASCRTRGVWVHFPNEPGARECPVSLHCRGRDVESERRFFDTQRRKKSALDLLALPLLELLQALERVRKCRQNLGCLIGERGFRDRILYVLQRHHLNTATTFLPGPVARVVAEDVAHRGRGDRKEVLTASGTNSALINQLEIGFVQQPGCVQGRIAMPCTTLSAGNCPQLLVHKRKARLESESVATFRGKQQLRDFFRRGGFACCSYVARRHREVVAPWSI